MRLVVACLGLFLLMTSGCCGYRYGMMSPYGACVDCMPQYAPMPMTAADRHQARELRRMYRQLNRMGGTYGMSGMTGGMMGGACGCSCQCAPMCCEMDACGMACGDMMGGEIVYDDSMMMDGMIIDGGSGGFCPNCQGMPTGPAGQPLQPTPSSESAMNSEYFSSPTPAQSAAQPVQQMLYAPPAAR